MKSGTNISETRGRELSFKAPLVAAIAIVACLTFVLVPVADDVEGTTATTLPDAVNGIITVPSGDYTLSNDLNASLVIPSGSTVVLDLAGYSITNSLTTKTNSKGTTIGNTTIEVSGTITINDNGTVTGEIIQTGAGAASILVKSGGIATLNGGYYHNTNADSYYVIKNFGTMTINSPVVVHNDSTYSSAVANGYYSDEERAGSTTECLMTINGGTFTGNSYVKNDDLGVMNVLGGSFNITEKGSAFMNYHKITFGSSNGSGPTIVGDSNYVLLNGHIDTVDKIDEGIVIIHSITADPNTVLVGLVGYSMGSITIDDEAWTGNILREGPGYLLDGTITMGQNSMSFSNLITGTSGLTVSVGSLDVSGDITTASDGSITVTGDAKASGTLGAGVSITIAPGATLTVPEGESLNILGSVNVSRGATMSIRGTATGTITGDGSIEASEDADLSGVDTDIRVDVIVETPDFIPFPDNRDDGAIEYTPSESASDDESSKVLACAAAAVVAAIIAVYLMYDMRRP